MQVIFRYILYTVVGLLLLLFLTPFILYIPSVQQGIAQYATRAASEQLGMEITLEKVRLRFPLDIELKKALVVTAQNDTMLKCKSLVLDLGLRRILKKEIIIEELLFEETKFHYIDSAETFNLKVDVEELKLMARPVNLLQERVTLPDILLKGGDVSLHLVSTPPDTTTSTSSFGWAFEVANLYLEDINYTMTTKPHETFLQSGIKEAKLNRAIVDIAKQRVSLNKASINGALCKYLSAPLHKNKSQSRSDINQPSLPWTIYADTLVMERSNMTYGVLNYVPLKYFDPSYISIYNLNVNADNIYNRAAEVSLNLNHLSFVERSGFRITHANTKLTLDSSKISVKNLYLSTFNSVIQGSATADVEILQQNPYANFNLSMRASLSMLDAPYFIPSIANALPLMPTSKIETKLDVGGSLSVMQLNDISLSVPDNISLTLKGDVAHLMDKKPLKARARIRGDVHRGDFLQSFIGNKDSVLLNIPDNIVLRGSVALNGDSIMPKLLIGVDNGRIAIDGAANLADEIYNVKLSAKTFPLSKFIKIAGLGGITTNLTACGKKFNPLQEGSLSKINLLVDTLNYNSFNYNNINLQFNLLQGKYNGVIASKTEEALFDLSFAGILNEQKQTVEIKGTIPNLNLQDLNLAKDKLALSSSVDISASADTTGIYSLKGGLGTTTVRMYGAKRTLMGMNMDILADTSAVRAKVEAKGLYLDFNSPISLDSLITQIDKVTTLVSKQTDSLRYNVEKIREIIPPCNLVFSLQDNPIITAILKRNGIALGKAGINLETHSEKPISLKSDIYALSVGEMQVDSINALINQRSNALAYKFAVNGIKGSDVNNGSIKLEGDIYDNIFSINCLQTDAKSKKGFDFGGKLVMLADSMCFQMTSQNPILGYEVYSVNKNNYVSCNNKGDIFADFSLSSGDKLLSLKTKNDSISNILYLKMKQLDIASMLKLWPLAPEVQGVLSSDLAMNLNVGKFGVGGELSINSLSYNKGLVGDLHLKAGYKALAEGGEQVLMALDLNDKNVIKLAGKHQPQTEEPMKMKLSIESLPFASINPFIPSDMAKLSGVLNGNFTVGGKSHDTKLNGYIQFQGVDLTLPFIGTTFTLSPEKITVTDNTIRIYNFGMSGPNKKPMIVEGSVAFGNLEETLLDINRIKTDLLITASNFQLVNVQKNNRTLVYGKAFSDMFLVLQGALDNLYVGGNVALLNGTELTYTMRDGGMAQQEDVSDLVTFTAFTDTLNQDEIDVKHQPKLGVDMSIGVSIGQAVKMAVNLTPDAKSGIDIQGGGELLYSMNMLGDTQFTGRYSISNGTVRYSLPVVATKVFDIDEGSFIEWSGDIADPIMNITAQNKVRATVNENGSSNMVNFYVTIGIKNSLNDLDLSFNLSAPENMAISNELASMSDDQRSEQALSMLLYNTYTGASGGDSNFDANSALGSFISKELNQWANRTLKNVDLSFGVDSYTNSTGESSFDYSYEFSKSLFNDRLRVAVGGSYNPDLLPNEVAQSILGDVSLEYQLDSRDNMLLKVFRSSTNDILEGNISEYGVGFAVRKQVLKLKELFQITGRKEKVAEKKASKKKAKASKQITEKE